MSMAMDGEFRRNSSVAARGFTSIEAMEFVRHEFPQVTSWTYWEVAHVLMGRLVDGKQWSGRFGEWRWEPVPCSYPAIFIWDSKAKRDGSLAGSNWTGVLKITGPDNIEFLLLSHLNAMGGIGNRYLISTQDPVLIETFSKAVYAYFQPKTNEAPVVTAMHQSANEIISLLSSEGLNMLAARPGQGKTSIALMLANHVVKQQKEAVLYISADQSLQQLRTCAQAAGVLPGSLVSLMPAAEAPPAIFVDDRRSPDAYSIIKDFHLLDQAWGLIVVDDIQLMNHKADGIPNYPEAANEFSRLKALAKEFALPILVLSQLKRPSENKRDASPALMQIPDVLWVEPHTDVICVVSSVPERRLQNKSPDFYKVTVLKNANSTFTVPIYLHA